DGHAARLTGVDAVQVAQRPGPRDVGPDRVAFDDDGAGRFGDVDSVPAVPGNEIPRTGDRSADNDVLTAGAATRNPGVQIGNRIATRNIRAHVVALDGYAAAEGGRNAVREVTRNQVARPRRCSTDQDVVDVLDHVDAEGVAERGSACGVGADAVALDG